MQINVCDANLYFGRLFRNPNHSRIRPVATATTAKPTHWLSCSLSPCDPNR